MVSATFLDLDTIDPEQVIMTREEIQELLPQRFEFAQLDRICYLDKEAGIIVAYKDLAEDEWWAKGHIPGKPLMPGVMMIEAAAQTGALLLKLIHEPAKGKFIGFGGVDAAKFRGVVSPPNRIFYAAKRGQFRSRVATMPAQAYVDKKLVFECKIMGAVLGGF